MALASISPLDGRYAAQVQSLAPYFSEEALIHYRVRVELAWFLTLSERPELPHIRPLTPRTLTNCLDSGSERVDKIGHLCSDGWRRTVPLPL